MKPSYLIKALIFLLLLSCTQERAPRAPYTLASGVVERYSDFPSEYISARAVEVWLPDGYPGAAPYDVLYMHDGQMLFDTAFTWNRQEWCVDEVTGRLIAEGAIAPAIVVGVWNSGSGRHADYFPQKPFLSLPQHVRDSLYGLRRDAETPLFDGPLRSDAYLRFLVRELKPFIDSVYRTNAGRESTVVAGSSMGGLISLYAICEYPEVFGGAACLSTHWPGIFASENNPVPDAFVRYLGEHLPDPATHRIYFDFGTETLDAIYEPYQLRVDSLMQAKGFDSNSWITKKFPGHNHSEAAWSSRLDVPVKFVLGGRRGEI